MPLSTASEDEEDLRLFSHTRPWLGSYMIPCQPRIVPREHFAPSSNQPSTNSLQKLPTELIFQVLSYLDLKSLTDLRAVDFWTKYHIDAFPAYEHLLQHAPVAVQALVDTRLITCFAISTLHDALRSDTCVGCDDFGPFLFLPLAKRSCFDCLQHNLLLRVITIPAARKCFDLSKKAIDGLPKLFNLPGNYGADNRQIKSRKYLVSVWEAQDRAIELHGGRDQMETAVLNNSVKEQTIFALKTTEWKTRSEGRLASRRPALPRAPKEILEAPNDPFRFLASVSFSLLHKDGTLEHGLSCVGCQTLKANDVRTNAMSNITSPLELLQEFERMDMRSYTVRDIIQHFQQCSGIRRIRAFSQRHNGA